MLQLCALKMKTISAFFRLIRWRNLLIVFLTQWFIWCCVVVPMKAWNGVPLFLDAPHFLLLSLSTILIAAAGYIINDYFDVRIDIINRPGKVIIGRLISRRWAIALHTLLNVIGLLIAVYLGWQLHNFRVISIQLACTILLWFYSTTFKRQFVTGNIAVALLTALTVLILAVFEPALYPYINFTYFIEEQGRALVNPFGVIAVYTYFAFMLTWMREIVKDMEDFKGDAEDGCVTMPIRIGLLQSSRWVIFLGILAVAPLMVAAFRLFAGAWMVLGIYIVLALVLPLVLLMIRLPRKATQQHYALMSRWLKIIMLAGIASLLLYYFLQYHC